MSFRETQSIEKGAKILIVFSLINYLVTKRIIFLCSKFKKSYIHLHLSVVINGVIHSYFQSCIQLYCGH